MGPISLAVWPGLSLPNQVVHDRGHLPWQNLAVPWNAAFSMQPRSLECLLDDVAFALRKGLGPTDLVPMLERILSLAPRGSEASYFGQLQLAELIVSTQPFRAASLARSVGVKNSSDRAWGIFGLAMTVMGHYRVAVKAFRLAIQLAPGHAGHLHNLGHVLDVGLGYSRSAVKYLELAHGNEPTVREIASSLAHAVARSGQRARALEILQRRVGMSHSVASTTVDEWLARVPACSGGTRTT